MSRTRVFPSAMVFCVVLALGLCAQVISAESDPEAALAAVRKQTAAQILADDLESSAASLQHILTDYAAHERLPHALHELAEACSKQDKAQACADLYAAQLTSGAAGDNAIWLRMGVALTHAYLANDAAADAAIETLIVNHAADTRCAEAVNQVAWAYRKLERYDRARMLYQHVADHWPANDRTIFAQRGIVLCSLELNDNEAADAATQALLQQFTGSLHMPEALSAVVKAYSDHKDWNKARPLCEIFLALYPDSKGAIWAQRGMILSAIANDDAQARDSGIRKLLERYASNTNMPDVLGSVAQMCAEHEHWAQARPLYRHILDHHPNSADAFRAQKGYVLSSIELGDESGALSGIEDIIAKFSSDKGMPKAVYRIARRLRPTNDVKAAELCKHIIERYPDHDYAPLAKIGLAQIRIRHDDDAAAEAIFAQVLAQYANHSYLPRVVHLMAEGYYVEAMAEEKEALGESPPPMPGENWPPPNARAHFERAVTKWAIITDELPETPTVTAKAHYFKAISWRRIGQYQKAIVSFQKVADQWPDFEYAWNARFLVAHTCKQAVAAGQMGASLANLTIKAAYTDVLAKYPSSPAAPAARDWLENNRELLD